MTEFPKQTNVSTDDLLWFAHICIMIGISDLRAINNNIIDDEDLNRLHKIMDTLVEE